MERAEIYKKFMESQKDYLDGVINDGIEKYRKGYAKLSFVDQNGNKVCNARIKGGLKKHHFKFGANLFMLDELETKEKNDKYKESFKKLFNSATVPFYWKDLEPEQGKPRYDKNSPKIYRRPAPDLCLEWCEQNGITPKAHCLVYEGWQPEWLPKSVPEVKELYIKRLKELSERYADRIPGWEVINEVLCACPTPMANCPDYTEWSLDNAEKYFNKNELIINEYSGQVFEEQCCFNRNKYFLLLKNLIREGHRIDTIGFQFHLFIKKEDLERQTQYYDLKRHYELLKTYEYFERPMQITEITIPAYSKQAEDEEFQAELTVQLYKLWFSQKYMEAIIYWNLVDGYAAFAEPGSEDGENYYHGGLLRFDLTEKPVYKALYNLIHNEWNTKFDEVINNEFEFKGFYGDYEIEVETDNKTVTASFQLKPDSTNDIIIKI